MLDKHQIFRLTILTDKFIIIHCTKMRILHAKAIFLIDKRQKSAEFRHILTPFAYGLYTILFYL